MTTRRGLLQGVIAGVALSAGSTSSGAPGPTAAKPFVLVHAAWHGGWCWRKVAPLLRTGGHEVHAPTLTGLGERAHLAHPMVGLDTHVQDIVNVLHYENLTNVVMAGHSSSGTLITAVAERVPERIAHLVYLDAFVPRDGEATIDLITFPRAAWEARVASEGHGWLIPSLAPVPWEEFARDVWRIVDHADRQWLVERLRPTPFKHFTDSVRLTSAAAGRIARTYVRCLQHKSPVFDRFAQAARAGEHWRLRELDSAHEPFVTAPRELSALLLEAAA
jgi:pimeloyl-ACP methyl ester carboxylesterase